MRAVVLFTTLLLASIAIFPQTQIAGGVRTVTFDTASGKIRLRLPDDMRAGDTISGTIVADAATLSGLVLTVDGREVPITGNAFTFGLDPSAAALSIFVKTVRGEVVSTVQPLPALANIKVVDFVPPVRGQVLRPLPITGPFDGDFSNTKVVVGGTVINVIAESPRKAVFVTPAEPLGNTSITISDHGQTKTAEFRNVGINLTAPKTNLMRGESTVLKVEVKGLEGIKGNVPVNLQTTGVVTTAGGNSQNIQIQPNQVQPGGVFSTDRQLTAQQAGNFNVTATVVVPISNLSGGIVHVEGAPNGGDGVWQLRVTFPDGTKGYIYIRSEQKPDLKYCNWIQLGDVTSEDGTLYTDGFKKVPPPKPPKPPDETKPPKPPDDKPPGPTTKPPDTTSKPPPCPEGAMRNIVPVTETFVVMDSDSTVSFKMYTDKDSVSTAAQNMADFWRDIAELGGLKDYLPEGTGAGPAAAEWLLKYLEKGADVLDAVSEGRLKNLGVGKVSVEVTITVKKITATCTSFEICVNGQWVPRKTLQQNEQRDTFTASKSAEKGDSEWEKVSDPSKPQLLDPAKAEQWAKDFLKDQANILKGNGDKYKDFVDKCK